MKKLLTLLFILSGGLAVHAELTIADIFTDNAVFQQKVEVPVWGTASPGSHVEVRFRDQSRTVTANADGRWRARLAPMLPGEATQLTVSGDGAERCFENVVVGEVWFASGQSNMEMPFNNCENAAEERAQVNDPQIRIFVVARASTLEPQTGVHGKWMPMASNTVGGVSAVAYYFAKEISVNQSVPVGIIQSAWGGSSINAWMSYESFQKEGMEGLLHASERSRREVPDLFIAYEAALADWKAKKEEAEKMGQHFTLRPPVQPSRWPASLFNGMVAPVMPYAIRGVIWYQGEADSVSHQTYAARFSTMIKDWRMHWRQGDFPFLFVQLPNWIQGGKNPPLLWAHMREAQVQALALPNTAMAVTVDIGDPLDVHPKNKKDVGKRLGLLALHEVYGQDVPCYSPMMRECRFESGSVLITFDHAKSLSWKDTRTDGFEIAGTNGKFYPAQAVISGNQVRLTAPEVSTPVAVHYAWSNNPEAILRNEHGLPATPFRNGDSE